MMCVWGPLASTTARDYVLLADRLDYHKRKWERMERNRFQGWKRIDGEHTNLHNNLILILVCVTACVHPVLNYAPESTHAPGTREKKKNVITVLLVSVTACVHPVLNYAPESTHAPGTQEQSNVIPVPFSDGARSWGR